MVQDNVPKSEAQSESPRRKRRRFQYSLRTLLVLMTATAIWLGIKVDQARRQQRAVEHIRACGGSVAYQAELPNQTSRRLAFSRSPLAPEWLRRFLGIDLIAHVREVRLYGPPKLHDADLAVLEALPGLEGLIISGDNITDDELAHLGNLHQLQELEIASPQVTNEGLTHLARLTELRYLGLHCPITDDGFRKLGTLKNLRILKSYGYGDSNLRSICATIDNPFITLEMYHYPLSEVFNYINDLSRVGWDADWAALEKVGIQRKDFEELPVTENTGTIRLRDALDRLLTPHGLTWTLGPQGIRITTPAAAAEKQAGLTWLKGQLPNLTETNVSVEW